MVASVGPYRFVNVTCGSRCIQYRKVGVGIASPHHSRRFMEGKSLNRTTSYCAMYFRMEGTENHCVSSDSRMKSASLCGSRLVSGDNRYNCAPARSVP